MKIVKELDNLSIDENLPIKKAVEVLDKNGFQILLLHNREGNLSSIVTDGDLRRFLLNDGDLNNSISLISNKDFTFLTEDQISHADKLFKINDFNHLPVIDKNKKLKCYKHSGIHITINTIAELEYANKDIKKIYN